MDFARKQLEKYGWAEGKGLGKKEDGISNALKPKLKFDNTGIGHDPAEEFTNDWWNNVYNSAINNIEVQKDNGNISINRISDESINITTSKYLGHNKQANSTYNNFVKCEKLMSDGIVSIKDKSEDATASTVNLPKLSDDELFAACGGRTAHKGARHGLKLSGKLSRIEKQEKLLLKKLQKVTINEDETLIKKKIKKLSENKESQLKQSDESMVDDYDSRSSTGSVTPKKKCKKKKKSVCFKDVVTEYTTHESTSLQSDDQTLITTIEETSIHDVDGATTNFSAEKVRRKIKDIEIQMEPYIKKHKKKKKNTATMRFLDNIRDEMNSNEADVISIDADGKCKKRKFTDNEEESKLALCVKDSKQKRKKKKQESINQMADNLNEMCKIRENGED